VDHRVQQPGGALNERGRSEAEAGSSFKWAVSVRFDEGRAPLLFQRQGLAQASRRAWAESPSQNVDGRQMLHEGIGVMRRSHIG
jgi:hypothetical protein